MPQLKPSEIFSLYAEQAQQRGLITKVAQETNEKKKEENPYNIKIKLNDSEEHILNQAHPESVVLFDAHDKLNGLVESLQERSDIMRWIVNKNPRGALTHQVYVAAHENLMHELIRVATKLDLANQSSLSKQADSCLNNFSKFAFWPYLIGLGVPVLYTLLSQNVILSQGVLQDTASAIKELEEAIDDYPVLKNELNYLMQELNSLKEMGAKVSAISIAMAPPMKNESDKANQAAAIVGQNKDEETLKILAEYEKKCAEVLKVIPSFISLLKLKEQQLNEGTSDFLAPISKVFRSIIPSDLQDAILKLETLQKSLGEAPKMIATQKQLYKEIREKVQGTKGIGEMGEKLEQPIPEIPMPKLEDLEVR